MEPHIRIINNAAGKILKPEGLFRVGSTRTWIEDNGYYFTIVAFESSALAKGSYLSVGLNYMWGTTKDADEYLCFHTGGREYIRKGTQFIEYRPGLKNCDSIFEEGINEFAEAALQKVKEYRRYRDPDHAREMLKRAVRDTPSEFKCWELYHLAMLCFFKGDHAEGQEAFYSYLDHAKNSIDKKTTILVGGEEREHIVHNDWLEAFYQYCLEYIVPLTQDAMTAQKMVYDKINARRSIFSAKKSYSGMNKEIVYS